MLSLSIAAVLLYFSFRNVEWKDFMMVLKDCKWGFVIISMLAGSFAFFLRALRWRMLLLPLDGSITRTTTFNGVNIGNISNFVFPRIGEFIRCGVITRRSSAPYDKVLGTVVLERGWELLVMLLMLAIVVVGGFDRFGAFFNEQILQPIAGRFNIGLAWIVTILAVLALAVLYAIWHFRKTNTLCTKIWGVINGFAQGFATCLKMEKKWMFFAYTLLIWMAYWFMATCTVWSVPFLDSLSPIDALFLSLVGGIGFAVPVPGGIGAFHFVISLALLGVYDVPMETGVIYATLSHTSQAITQVLFGLGSYAYEAAVPYNRK